MKWKPIGALWVSTKGKAKLQGSLDLGPLGDARIMIFPNEDKKEDRHPDYRICLVPPDDGEERRSESTRSTDAEGSDGLPF